MNNKGITLIALVITIIVLLILAGVSIAMLTGQNGILTQASSAKSDTAKAEIAEKVNLAIQAKYAENLKATGTTTTALTESDVASQYNTDNGTGLATAGSGSLTVKASSATGAATYTVTLTKSGNSFAAVTKDNVQ